MKRIFSILALASIVLWSSSCLKLQRPDNSEKEAEIAQAMEKFVMADYVTVEVPAGKIAVVTQKGTNDTIAVLPTTASILAPCSYTPAETKALGDPSIDIKIVSPAGFSFDDVNKKYWAYYTLVFEDSIVGDYDYNDLVLNICIDNTTSAKSPTLNDYIGKLFVRPIACGSTKKIGFGMQIGKNGKEILLTEDVRKDFFNGTEGFINTGKWQKEIMKFDVKEVYTQNSWLSDIYFFIQVGGTRLYAANANLKDKIVLDDHKCPYGMLITSVDGNVAYFNSLTKEDKNAMRDHGSNAQDNILRKCRSWWLYPYEGVSLDEAYYYDVKSQYKGWLDCLLKTSSSMYEFCYLKRSDKSQVFPSVNFREDGTLDPKKTVYYGNFTN